MKIAYLAAANSIHAIRWIRFFAERGHEIVWITLAPASEEAKTVLAEFPKISFTEITPSPLADISGKKSWFHLVPAALKVRRILASQKPDLLHVHSAGTYGLVAVISGFHPAVLTPWGSDILLNFGFKKILVSYAVRYADHYTCDGENTSKKLVELGAKKENIAFIRFGTDIRKFKPTPKTSENPTVISLRSLEPVYDIETLLKAAVLVVKEMPEAKFVIAGDGSQKENLENLSKELGLETSVKFTGRYAADNLPDMLRNADVYVSTSLSDSGLASSTAEAMASGMPVVVTDSGDNRAWIEENKGGFVVPVKNPEALAEKILWLLKHPESQASFGSYNRNIIEEKYNFYKEMEKVEKVYLTFGGQK